MASFTDNIPQFNPYIQQLPVEAMVKVGMEKQQRYDQGIQKIQTSIDNIAGLDVIRDIDKAYLQSTLNQLGNNLKTVAAGDFSNYQLVNSVSGMANQIIKDPNVQNAVSSTAWYRKQAGDMEKAITEGKASQSNIWDFSEKANGWLNSKDINSQFRDRYTPYTDVKKKAMEAIKALHPNLKEYDIPFEVDGNGRINTRKIADAMQRYKIEGIDETQIQQAIFASMTPDDINQLSIDARYQFRGVDSEQLVGIATKNYESQKQQAVEDLAALRNQKQIVSDPTKLSKIDASIAQYERVLGLDGKPGTLDESLLANVDIARTNPNQVKLNIYKDGFVKEFANAFSWKNESSQYVTNPLKQQENWNAEMKFKQQQEARQRYEFGVNTSFKLQELDLKKQELALKKIELFGDAESADWTGMGNPTDNVLKATETLNNQKTSVSDAIESDKAALGKKYTPAQIKVMLDDWQNAQGVASKAKLVPADAVELIKNIAKNNNYFNSITSFEKRELERANKEAGVTTVMANALQGKNPMTVTLGSKKIVLSPEEILGLKAATSEKTTSSKLGNTREVTVDRSKLNSNQLNFVNSMSGIIYGRFEPGPSGLTQNQRKLQSSVNAVFSGYNKPLQDLGSAMSKAQEIYRNNIAGVVSKFEPEIKAVATGKSGEPPTNVLIRLSQLLTAADAKQIAGDENFDLTTASNMLKSENKKDTRVFVYHDGDDYRIYLKSESDPKQMQVLKVGKQDVVNYLGAGYVKNLSQESVRLDLGRGNTNINKNPLESLMQKQFGDFPRVTRLQVTADLNQDLSNDGLFTPIINIKKKDGRYQSFELSGPNKDLRVGFDQGKSALNNLDDETLLKRLKQEYPTFDFSVLDY